MPQSRSFEIRSGHVCFGEALHNIYHGAITPAVQELPRVPPVGISGTVAVSRIDFNLPAINGTWIVHPLYKEGNIAAYFVAHSSVDAKSELLRILRIAGSPYEYESGSQFNDPDTYREGLLVINRYDWGYTDGRSKEMVKEVETNPPYASVGLVDMDVAHEAVQFWQGIKSDERPLLYADNGVWFHIPWAEYCFGRFTFDADRRHARSFLFFTGGTDFFHTSFEGDSESLRKPETTYEMLERRLKTGFDFSGLKSLKHSWTPQPPAGELWGPYPPEDHVLNAHDVRTAFRVAPFASKNMPNFPIATYLIEIKDEFAKQSLENWWLEAVKLLNEFYLSFMDRAIITTKIDISTVEAYKIASETLFHAKPSICREGKELNSELAVLFFGKSATDASEGDVRGPDSVLCRVEQFLLKHSVHAHQIALYDICKNFAFVLLDIMERARNISLDSSRYGHVVPADIRLAIINDNWWYTDNFKYSKALWSDHHV